MSLTRMAEDLAHEVSRLENYIEGERRRAQQLMQQNSYLTNLIADQAALNPPPIFIENSIALAAKDDTIKQLKAALDKDAIVIKAQKDRIDDLQKRLDAALHQRDGFKVCLEAAQKDQHEIQSENDKLKAELSKLVKMRSDVATAVNASHRAPEPNTFGQTGSIGASCPGANGVAGRSPLSGSGSSTL